MMRVNPTRSRLIVGSLPMLALAWAGCGAGEAGGPSDAVLYENDLPDHYP